MELTRRDAVFALAAASTGSLAGCAALRSSEERTGAETTGAETTGAETTGTETTTTAESSPGSASSSRDTTGRDATAASSDAGRKSPIETTDATDGALDDQESATLVALAEVVYPTTVDGIEGFVRTYIGGRLDGDESHARGVHEAIDTLDAYAMEFHDSRYADLSREIRRGIIDHMSVDVADPVPDGTATERVRHYLVNELLYALYTSPTGAKLAGLENPPGHPGGIQSYQEGPPE